MFCTLHPVDTTVQCIIFVLSFVYICMYFHVLYLHPASNSWYTKQALESGRPNNVSVPPLVGCCPLFGGLLSPFCWVAIPPLVGSVPLLLGSYPPFGGFCPPFGGLLSPFLWVALPFGGFCPPFGGLLSHLWCAAVPPLVDCCPSLGGWVICYPPFGGWVAAPPYLITNKPTQFIWLAGIPAKKKRPRTLINNNKQCNRSTKSATNVCPPATNLLTIMESVIEWVGGFVSKNTKNIIFYSLGLIPPHPHI